MTELRATGLGTAAESRPGQSRDASLSRRRRLLCVYQHAPTPGAPGIYRHRLYLSRLVERGWNVDLVSTPLNYMTGELPDAYRRRPFVDETIDGIDHHWVWASRSIHRSKRGRVANYVTFASAALARAALLPRPDVILVSSPPLPVAGLGSMLGLRHRAPWLLEVRDIWPESAAAVGWLSPDSPRLPGRGALRPQGDDAGVRRRRPDLRARGAGAPARRAAGPGRARGGDRHTARTMPCEPGHAPSSGSRPTSACSSTRARSAWPTGSTCCSMPCAALPEDLPATVVVAGDGSALADVRRRVEHEGLRRIRRAGRRHQGSGSATS